MASPCPSSSTLDREINLFQRLLRHYGPQHWWPAQDAFEVIVGALLMQQTAWRNVAEAIQNLKEAGLLEVRALAAAPMPVIRRHVKIAGLYRTKPKRLRDFCRHLLNRSDGDLTRYFDRSTDVVRNDLLAQDGVGPETADSILLYAGGHPVFLVDAYTIRIGRESASSTRTRTTTSRSTSKPACRETSRCTGSTTRSSSPMRRRCAARRRPAMNAPSAFCATSGGDGSDKRPWR